jgi:hypothetical protein
LFVMPDRYLPATWGTCDNDSSTPSPRGHDQGEHDAGGLHGFQNDSRQIGEPELAIDEKTEHQRVGNGNGGGLGRREHAPEQAREKDHRGQQCPERGLEGTPQIANARKGMARQVETDGDRTDHDHQRPCHQ